MTVVPRPSPLPLLATPGERLGWIFNDRNLYRRKFLESPPQPAPLPSHLLDRLNRAQANQAKRVLTALGVGVGLSFLLACCGSAASRGDTSSGGSAMMVLGFVVFVGGVAGAVLAGLMPSFAKKAIETEQARLQHEYSQAYAAWDARRQWHEQQQQQATDAMVEWAAATPSPGTRRVDIIGGTTYGWEAVLTVFGGSLLATRGPMTLVDFTGEALCAELTQLATETRRTVRELRLPTQLAEFDLVGGLESGELVDCLVEAMHGDAQSSSRAERSQDTLLLREICGILAPDLSVARLLGALRVLTDRPVQAALTPDESERLLELQPDESRRQMHQHLRRIEAFLNPFETMGSRSNAPAPADLTCLVTDGQGGNAQNELLKDLMVQWLARLVRRDARPMGSLVLLGADEVHHRSIEKLSTLCERHGVRLVLFFSHLREESLHTIGGGEVALMRLGNHQEANQAADYIGKGHKFVLSQLTRTLGGNDTHTLADTHGETWTEGGSDGKSYSRQGSSRNYGRNWSKSRNWSQTESTARGTNWSDASSVQRVYEYTLEPRVLQDLPEYAMVLVKSHGRGSVIQAVEVDPAIVTLPRVSMEPVEPLPLPDPSEAVIPATRQPSQVTVSQPQPLAGHEQTAQAATGHTLQGWGAAPSGAPQPQYQQQPYQGPWGGPQ
ncbi:hypothetical protein [Paractinoplanes maris]|uniref:hypothetical protein n=1 Tax=Paractinoplanes maris TaxID=1734446 RepID=UPI002021BDC2|nr:hypothetical protein [Actinoplanes maris]